MNKISIAIPPEKKLVTTPNWIEQYIAETGPDEPQLLKKIQEQLSKLTEEQKTKRLIEVNKKLDELEQENRI